MVYMIAGLVVIVSYLLGSVSSAVLISKKISGEDIRNSGSGNAGATNMLRVHGKKAGIITLLCDALKGVIAVIIAVLVDKVLENKELTLSFFEENVLLGNLKYLAGVGAVLGHDFPIYFGFRGGKGVATSLGVMLAFDWKIGLIIALISVFVMAVSRFVSLGSVLGAVIYPVAVLFYMIGKNNVNLVYFISAFLLGVIAIIKHKANIKRLIKGEENKLF